MTPKKTTYLVSIFISAPTTQHQKIKPIAAQLSNDEYEFLHLHQMGAFLVLNTDRSSRDLAKAFAPAIASEDKIFICEVGNDWHATGLNKGLYWLQNHLTTKDQPISARKDNPFGDT